MGEDIKQIGAFSVIEEMSRGNTGRVFLVQDPERRTEPDGLCALKLIDARHLQNKRYLDTMRREAPRAVRFSHTYAARKIDVAYDGERAYVVRELVNGMPACGLLDQMRLHEAHLPWEFAVTLGVQLSRLMRTAHRFGAADQPPFVHGSLSCSNLYVTFSGFAKVVGLGLAQTRALLPAGVRQLPFRAPELVLGEKLSFASDVYGIGATLYALLAGRRPFDEACVAATRQAILHVSPPSVRVHRPEVPAALDSLIQAMMRKRPQDRPADLADIERRLRELLHEPDAFYADGLAQTMAIYFPHLARAAEDRREDWLARRRLTERPTPRAVARPWPARPSRPSDEADVTRGRRQTGDVLERIRTPKPATGLAAAGAEVIQGPWAEQVPGEPSLEGIDKPGPFDVTAVVERICASRGPADPLADLVIEPPEEALDNPFDSVTPQSIKDTSDLLMEADRGLEAGTVIGDRYRIVDMIGQGGASMVYRAEHTALRKVVAVKVLKPELCALDEAARRFHQEARAMSKLDHPNIARVTDCGRTANGSLFLVMELVSGRCLADMLLDSPRLQASLALKIALDVLEGLAHAHAHGVVHRDLKPDNIMVDLSGTRPTAKVLDFGIAKVMETPPESRLTLPGRVFGTPRYMAPEQAKGRTIDGRVDLYALGATLYEMLEGRAAFDGDNAFEVLTDVLNRVPPPITISANPTVRTDRVAEVVQRAMSKAPEQRFADANEMIEAIRGCFFFPPSDPPSPRPRL